MGIMRLKRISKNYLINFILFLVITITNSTISFSQCQVNGKVINTKQEPAVFVNVILKDSLNQNIELTTTNEEGLFLISDVVCGEYFLEFTGISYEKKTEKVYLQSKKEAEIQVTLEDNIFNLGEVLIKTSSPIKIKKDTVSFKTKYFAKGDEKNVEDLLKRIPGLQIDSKGTIKLAGKEIEKLMIDGDDLFEKGYKILSKNMPAHPIEEVELLKNYSNNPLLKGIERSNKVALNLKLDKNSKRIWFGNMEIAYGKDDFYEIKGNLMNFGKKNKYYFLANGNNIGEDATGSIEDLIQPISTDETVDIGDDQQVENLIDLSVSDLGFEKRRTNFNDAELVSVNAIFNPTKKLKIKTLGFFNWDETYFFRNSENNVTTASADFTNTEDYMLNNINRTNFVKLDADYKLSENANLQSITKLNHSNFASQSNLVFNQASTAENLESDHTLFDQKIKYSHKFKKNKVWILTGRYILEQKPQEYRINQFFYRDLFPGSFNVDNVLQNNKTLMQFAGLNARLLEKKKNGDLLEWQLGNAFKKNKLYSDLLLLQNEEVIDSPQSFQNRTSYSTNDLFLKSKYHLKLKNITLIGEVGAHQFFNHLTNNQNLITQNPFFINPSIGMDWQINNKNKITSTYSYNTSNTKLLDVHNNFVLTGFRSFSKGTGNFNQLDASTLIIKHQLGNWSDRFFANTLFLYNKNHDFLSTNTLIDQNFSRSEKILIKDQEFLNISSKLDYYIKFVSTNIKLDLGYTKTEFKNIVNNSQLRKINSINYKYGLELHSGFSGIFNYHIGTKWTTNTIKSDVNNSFTDVLSFLDLSFIFNKKLRFNLQSERYYFGSLTTDNTYYFLDFNARYAIKKKKLTFTLSGKNLFNTQKFRNFAISDIGNSTTEYRLLPRFLLLKMEYSF